MNKNKNGNNIFVYIILLIIFIFCSIFIYFLVKDNQEKTISSTDEDILEIDDDVVPSAKPFDEDKYMKVIINDIEYEVKLENNIAAYDFLSVLPIELNMEDLNNNEKYSYLSYSLTNMDNYTGKIYKGDIMLYQSNCIVIFYKDFDTTYSYTKIGHIDNLAEMDSGSIKVIFK